MQNFQDLITEEMLQVDDFISSHLTSKEGVIEAVSKYLISSGGKRMRPALLVLCAKLLGYNEVSHIKLAGAVELIHAATLLHDDVVDNSSMRRFKPSAHVVWGNRTSILVGDFLFALSFKMMVEASCTSAMNRLSDASSVMVEGEVYQMVRMKEKSMPTIDEYYKIITAKTAELFSASCEIGAIIASNNPEIRAIFRDFGLKLGIIFQISDDALDYFGTGSDIGKNIGDDFMEGKVTLPVILAHDASTSDEKKLIEELLFTEQYDMSRFDQMLAILNKYSVKDKISVIKDQLISDATSLISVVNMDDKYRNALLSALHHAAYRII